MHGTVGNDRQLAIFQRSVGREGQREKWERLLLSWTRELASDLKSIANRTVGTLAIQRGTWCVKARDRA